MRIPTRDRIATGLVACAVIVYTLWATGLTLLGIDAIRVSGMVVLGLGFAASASAVVPGFDELLHGSKLYLLVTSVIGLLAFVAGAVMLVAASEVALGMVMAAMVVLWMIATVHHTVLASSDARSRVPAPSTRWHGRRSAGAS
jgi:hypothetical protein